MLCTVSFLLIFININILPQWGSPPLYSSKKKKKKRKNKPSCHCLCFLLLLHMHIRIGMFVLWNLSQWKIPCSLKRKKKNHLHLLYSFLSFLICHAVMLLHPQSTWGHNSHLSNFITSQKISFRIAFRVLIQNRTCDSTLLFPHRAAYEVRTSLNTSEYISSVVQCEISTMI